MKKEGYIDGSDEIVVVINQPKTQETPTSIKATITTPIPTTPTPTPVENALQIPPASAPAPLVQIMGVILILAGLIFTALTALKKDVVIEFGIPEKKLKYAGGVGIILVIIGAYILLKGQGLV